MNDEFDMQSGSNGCPKRLWVMLTLSDDEVLDARGELPLGLRVHLRQCDSCRELSERLLAVSSGLQQLGRPEPPTGLLDKADGQLVDALRSGAAARLGESLDERWAAAGSEPAQRRRIAWRSVARYAVAAVFVFAITLPPLWRAGYLGNRPAASRIVSDEPSNRGIERQNYATTEGAAVQPPPKGKTTTPIEEGPAPADERLAAGSDNRDDSKDDRKLRICTFDSYGEPPRSDDATCIYRGFPLPRQQKPPRNRR